MLEKFLAAKVMAAIGVATVGVVTAGAATGVIPSASPVETTTTLDESTTSTAVEESTTSTLPEETTMTTSIVEETTTTVVDEATTTTTPPAPEEPELERGPDPHGPARFGLCNAFASRAEMPEGSVAAQNLQRAAAAEGRSVEEFCADATPGGRDRADRSDQRDAARAPRGGGDDKANWNNGNGNGKAKGNGGDGKAKGGNGNGNGRGNGNGARGGGRG